MIYLPVFKLGKKYYTESDSEMDFILKMYYTILKTGIKDFNY